LAIGDEQFGTMVTVLYALDGPLFN